MGRSSLVFPSNGARGRAGFPFTSETFHVTGNTSLRKDFWAPFPFHQDNSWSKTSCYLLILARMCCSNSDSGNTEKKEGAGTFKMVLVWRAETLLEEWGRGRELTQLPGFLFVLNSTSFLHESILSLGQSGTRGSLSTRGSPSTRSSPSARGSPSASDPHFHSS